MIDRMDKDGKRELRYPISINSLKNGDRIYLLTQKDNLRKVEKALGN